MASNTKQNQGQTSILLKGNYEVSSKVEAFYTGGQIQFSDDCEYLFCTCGDTVKVLTVADGKVQASIKEDDDEVTCFIVSPDDKYLFTAKRSLLLRVWNWRDSTLVRKFKAIHTAPVVSMAFDSTSTLLATGSSDKTIKVWDVIKQYCTHNFKGSDGVVSLVKFHPDPEKLQLFSTSTDCKIRIWDLQTSKCISILNGHFSAVTSICFTKDNLYMVSGGRDKVILLWDLSSRSIIRTIPTFENIEGIITVPPGCSCPGAKENGEESYFISIGEKGNFKVWRLTDMTCVHETLPDSEISQLKASEGVKESSEPSSVVTQLLLCKTSATLACATYSHNIIIYDICSLRRRKQFVGYYDEILEIHALGDKCHSLAVATNSSELKILELQASDCHVLCGHSDTILSLDISFDNKFIATCSKDNSIRVWEVTDSDGKREYKWVAYGVGHTSAVGTISWPKQCRKFLITGSEDHTIKLWNVPGKYPETEPSRLQVKWTEKAHDKDINCTDISPNDKLAATGSQDKTAKIWATESGTLLGTLRGHRRGLWCVQFSPVDQCLATASADSTIKIWAIADFTCVKTLEGHSNSVLKIQFVTRGMQLLSSGSDGLVKLWNVRTNECIKTFDEHEDKIWALAVSKEEDMLITGGADSALILWKDVTKLELEADRAKQEELLLREQELSNLLQNRRFLQAVSLAITLEKPFKVLGIFKDILGEENGRKLLTETLGQLKDDQIHSLLKFACDWNTNAKHSFVAQSVLSIILRQKSPNELLEYPNMKETIEALLPYSERHLQRLNRMIQQSTFLEYTWQTMKLSTNPAKLRERVEDETLPEKLESADGIALQNSTINGSKDDEVASSGSVSSGSADESDQDLAADNVKIEAKKRKMVSSNGVL